MWTDVVPRLVQQPADEPPAYVASPIMDVAHSANLFAQFEECQQLLFRLCTHDLFGVFFVYADGRYL